MSRRNCWLMDLQVAEAQTLVQMKIFYMCAMSTVTIMSTSEVPFLLFEI